MNRIKELREARDIQQKELAISIGVSQPTVSDWESGRKTPSAKSTMKLSSFFDVSVEYLMGNEEKRRIIPDSDIKFAVFGDPDVTDAQFEEIKKIARIIRERDKK